MQLTAQEKEDIYMAVAHYHDYQKEIRAKGYGGAIPERILRLELLEDRFLDAYLGRI